ncbi:uncharacterized protein ASCRUDRAFT_76969 [Ascoidea rubescens DSM 1968]|uniref:Amino acid permease/ SLC12A domain-containing protein n=1 Tax=Ascoidea rubescens DSM 1968 TaxID=1344418 RepID=A0A1D2VD88_9ASCO|nr:hypothetical protein ASCRUDRAFT_76969 [Ascoidea rubescens DSM 1968]ODV59606.1 hypothetical protein ASCRUDRAFT_76969 [Ascoidea rubescens DSM 1968]
MTYLYSNSDNNYPYSNNPQFSDLESSSSHNYTKKTTDTNTDDEEKDIGLKMKRRNSFVGFSKSMDIENYSENDSVHTDYIQSSNIDNDKLSDINHTNTNNIDSNNIDNASMNSSSTSSTIYRQVSYELHQVQSPQPLAVTPGHRLIHSLTAIDISAITLTIVFGTGLLIGTAKTLHIAGPISLLIAYIVMGFVALQLLNSYCEMMSYIPIPNAYSGYTSRYLDPSIGFALGYCYLFVNLITGPNQLTAGALVVQYWVDRDTVNPAVWVTIFSVVVILINTVRVGKFAILSIFFISFKLIIMIGVVILLFILMLGGGPNHDRIGFRYWKDPGPFAPYSESVDGNVGKLVSFLSVLVTACYSYLGVETFVVTAAESVHPRATIPKARKFIVYPLLLVYISFITMIGICVAFDDQQLINQNPFSSPVIVAIKNASIPILSSIFNACILVFALSGAINSFYIATRVIYGLSVSGDCFRILSKTNRFGIPSYCIAVVSCFELLAFMNSTQGSTTVFNYLVDSASSFCLIVWDCILLTHIFFVRAFKTQGVNRKEELHYYAPGAPYTTSIALFINIIVTIICNFTSFIDGFDYKQFISGYIGMPVFIIVFLVHKVVKKTSFIKPEEADLYFYKDYVDAEEEAYLKHMNDIKKEEQELRTSKLFEIKRKIKEYLQ